VLLFLNFSIGLLASAVKPNQLLQKKTTHKLSSIGVQIQPLHCLKKTSATSLRTWPSRDCCVSTTFARQPSTATAMD